MDISTLCIFTSMCRTLAYWLIMSVLDVTSDQDYFFIFHSIPINTILFCSHVPFHSFPFHTIPLQTTVRTAWRLVTAMPSSPTALPTRPRAPTCVARPTVPWQRWSATPLPATVPWTDCSMTLASASPRRSVIVAWNSPESWWLLAPSLLSMTARPGGC